MDAASDILQRHDVPVIFITAFPEHLLTGERPEPAFLITKPFREETVKALIGQALFFHTPKGRAPYRLNLRLQPRRSPGTTGMGRLLGRCAIIALSPRRPS